MGIQSMPIASFQSSMLPRPCSLRLFGPPVDPATVTYFQWCWPWVGWLAVKPWISKMRCLTRRRPNMEPHSSTSRLSGACGTFSMMNGTPVLARRSRTQGMSLLYLERIAVSPSPVLVAIENAWQGGEAQMRSKLRSHFMLRRWTLSH